MKAAVPHLLLLLALGMILLVFASSIPGISVMNPQGGNGILWFLMLYCTGAYLRRFPPERNAVFYVIAYGVCLIISVVSQFGIAFISEKLGYNGAGAARLSTFDSFPVYLASVAVFCAFLRLRGFTRGGKLLTWLSAGTFSVYLLHEHDLLRPLIWGSVKLNEQTSAVVIPEILGVSCVIFAAGILVDLFWRPIGKALQRIKTPGFLTKVEKALAENERSE